MKKTIKTLINSFYFFPFLLPVFFVVHGFQENYDFVQVNDAFNLIGIYIAATAVMIFLLYLFFKNLSKASLITFLLMSFHFFFGSVYDIVKKKIPHSFFSTYSFIIPATLILLIITIFLLKRKPAPPKILFLYLNSLFLILLLIDGISIAYKYHLKETEKRYVLKRFEPYTSGSKPDIYCIILDEYAGQKELNELLKFNNSLFYTDLEKRDYHLIRESKSNYFSTPLSVASFFNMDYLDFSKGSQEQEKVLFSYNKIRHSPFLQFLLAEGYNFYNFSIFDFYDHKSIATPTFLPTAKTLITSQTFLSRIQIDLGYHLYTTLHFKQNLEDHIYTDLRNNENAYAMTSKIASEKAQKPKFVYTHLMMPHYPYYFNKDGVPRSLDELTVKNKFNPEFYTEYLSYCNKKILTLSDEIQKKSPGAIIILAGDHGFRAFNEEVDTQYFFNNFCALYLPSNKYAGFYNGLSPVNMFRVLLNTEFNQKLNLLKDSTVLFNKE